MSQGQDWTFHGFAGEFDGHVREKMARSMIWGHLRAMWGACWRTRLRRAVRG